ncbi:MAG: HmuY family protein [Porphyromonas sp.]|nr:HmuY family protein [Porphyromonas sp.]
MKKITLTKTFMLLFAVSLGVFFTSCKDKNKPDTPNDVKTASYISANSYTKWVYFSLESGKVVKVEDPTKSKDWDLGFHRQQIRVNDKNFAGVGKAQMLEETNFDAKISPDPSKMIENREIMIPVGVNMSNTDNPYILEKGFCLTDNDNFLKNTIGSYSINMSEMGKDPSKMYPVNKKVFVFLTADGKTYYKLQFTSALSEEGKGGHLSFKFVKL